MRQFGRPDRFVLLTMLFLLAGCDSGEEPIDAYTIKKHDSIQIPIDTEATQPMEASTHRLLAGVILDDGVAWYFKSISPLAEIPQNAAEQFERLLQGIRLEDAEKPTWDLDDAWTELPGSGMRVANLMLDKVEFAVSKLPMRSDTNARRYLLDNINRWRKQIGLLPISTGQLDKYARRLVTADGHEATIVDFNGKLDASAMPSGRGMPPPMVGGGNPAVSKPITYDAPEHWKEQKAGMMQLATFLVGEGDASASISVSQLGGAAGGVLANVNRWRGQVGLEPLQDEKDVNASPMKVGGNDAVLLDFRGDQGKSITVAMVPSGGSVWFFKMMGATAVVDQESESFRDFLASVRLN